MAVGGYQGRTDSIQPFFARVFRRTGVSESKCDSGNVASLTKSTLRDAPSRVFDKIQLPNVCCESRNSFAKGFTWPSFEQHATDLRLRYFGIDTARKLCNRARQPRRENNHSEHRRYRSNRN